MILIIGGVLCYDVFMQCEFTLHAYIIAWTGDIPALSKVMNITGHNSYSGCRFCDIRGIYSQKYRHVYFPTNLKERYTKKKLFNLVNTYKQNRNCNYYQRKRNFNKTIWYDNYNDYLRYSICHYYKLFNLIFA